MIIVGRFGTPYGVKGWMKIHSFTDPVENIMDYQPWFLATPEGWQPLTLTGCQRHHGGVIAAIESCTDRDQTARYRNRDIAVPRAALPVPEAGSYYWSDLVGLEVVDSTGTMLGIVDHLFSTPAHDIMVVKNLEREYSIPYVLDTTVTQVDLNTGKIHVTWDTDFQ